MSSLYIGDLPVIPLRGIVALPLANMGFDVGRDESVNAVEVSTANDALVVLVAQKDPKDNEVNLKEMFEIGCICRIKHASKLSGNSMRLIVEGVARARIDCYTASKPYIIASVTELKDEPCDKSESTTLRMLISRRLGEFSYSNGKTPLRTAINAIESIEDDSAYVYGAANIALQRFEDRQQVLEQNDYSARCLCLLTIMARELEFANLSKKIDADVRQAIEKSQKDYFLREQIRAIRKELGETEQTEADGFRERLEKKNVPDDVRERIQKEIERFASLPAGSHEMPSSRAFIECMLDLPFTETSEDNLDIENARRILDADHYGLTKVKDRVLEHLAVAQLTGKVNGQILCFVGPPGVGKTSISSSIASALGRRFVRMSLGGIRDEAEIRGHRRTYIGAMPGRIIAAMRTAGTVNPVLLFDEIDKLSQDYQGDPAAAMLEVLDSAQNFAFRDHFLEMPYDLSKVMFITTANTMHDIPRPLLDRMEIIEVPSYLENEKVQIAVRHLIPKQLEKHGLKKSMLSIPESLVGTIISDYTSESGVRSLERCIAAICRKAACDIANGRKRIRLTPSKLREYLGNPKFTHEPADVIPEVGMVNGLAWTAVGGETMEIEAEALKGNGQVQLTGKLGEVMQESARAAITCIRAHASDLCLSEDFNLTTDIHIHVPEGAVPKDGPSAGIAMMTAVASALTHIPVRAGIAMTGEITLRGRVLPIGGLREKLLAAVRAGIHTVLIPAKNRRDVEDVPSDITNALNIVYVTTADEVLRSSLLTMPKQVNPASIVSQINLTMPA